MSENHYPTALTIAGSDPSGGAGLQADLKTFSFFQVFGMTAVTALTIGNTTGVKDILELDAGFVSQQIEAVIADIPPRAIKTGLLANASIIKQVQMDLQDVAVPVVVDPVMVTKRGDVLLSDSGVDAYRNYLVPHADIVTPNIPEAELLAEIEIVSPDAISEAAKRIMDLGCRAVVIKGGYFEDWQHSNDLFYYEGGEVEWLLSPRIQTQHTHGSGDAFSAAITAGLANGKNRMQAVKEAKKMVTGAIRNAPELGKGQGPIGYNI